MECDSIHSTIENAKKKTAIYVPSHWNTVILLARRSKPYIAVPMKYSDVLDLKYFVTKCCPNMKVATTGEKINWLKVRWIQVRKEEPRSLFINYSFSPDNFMEIKVQATTRNKGRPSGWLNEIPSCYQAKLPISVEKKKDLISLCKRGIIPEEFHSYYSSLTTIHSRRKGPYTSSWK
jgi:hypothetical protein